MSSFSSTRAPNEGGSQWVLQSVLMSVVASTQVTVFEWRLLVSSLCPAAQVISPGTAKSNLTLPMLLFHQLFAHTMESPWGTFSRLLSPSCPSTPLPNTVWQMLQALTYLAPCTLAFSPPKMFDRCFSGQFFGGVSGVPLPSTTLNLFAPLYFSCWFLDLLSFDYLQHRCHRSHMSTPWRATSCAVLSCNTPPAHCFLQKGLTIPFSTQISLYKTAILSAFNCPVFSKL